MWNNERRLWCAVLYRQLRDVMSGTPHIRDSAIHYLTRKSRDLRIVCEMAEFDMDSVIRAAKRLEGLGIKEGVLYLGDLMKEDEVDDDDRNSRSS